MPESASPRAASWKWIVCGLLFLATLLNYMDRQTLAQTSKQIKNELSLTADHYGTLEMAFGLAFAAGGLLFGVLADRVNVWALYPIVLLGWSAAGFLTGSADVVGLALMPHCPQWLFTALGLQSVPSPSAATYLGLFTCRVILGLFEAGQWPCALVTTQRLLSQQDRTLGNSLLQSGASIGAILTPIASLAMVSESVPGSWTILFRVIGIIGVLWLLPWFAVIRPSDLALSPAPADAAASPRSGGWSSNLVRQYLAVACTVILINLTWHFYRAWLPLFLGEHHKYSKPFVDVFMAIYYLATDVGCIAVGMAVRGLTTRGWTVHTSRLAAFAACAGLTAVGMLAGFLPAGALLLGSLNIIAAGSLGLFPIYYSLTQDLSAKHQGKVTGSLSCLTWCFTAAMQKFVGKSVEETHSYAPAFMLAGLAPLLALLAIWLLWPREERR